MSDENPLKQSINQRLQDERYRIPRKKKERRVFNVQIIMIISILLGLLFTLIGIIRQFI